MRAPTPRIRALLVALVTLVVAMVSPTGSVRAHTAFESSTPAEGEVLDAPVDTVVLEFTGAATPVDGRIVALDGDGTERAPTTIETPDDRRVVLRFEPPLSGGPVGVRWSVRAPDAHVVEGALSFTVPSAAASAPNAAPTTVAPAVPTAGEVAADTPSSELAAFLDVDGGRPGETTGLIGRIITFAGVVMAIGLVAVAATTVRGSRREVTGVVLAARAAGAVVAVGAVVEYIGLTRAEAFALGSAWYDTPGAAMALRFVGGLALALGLRTTFADASARMTQALSAAVVEEAPPVTRNERTTRWRPDATSWLAVAGLVALIVSFWFDGHTTSKGPRVVHVAVDTVHVVAGSVWAGGVVTLAALVWRRWRTGRPIDGAGLVLRFSRPATVSLVAVLAAGVLMAWVVLDSLGQLTSTEWGQVLLLKSGAVTLAAGFGAYNHLRLLPAYEADLGQPELDARLRATLTAEGIVLAFVVLVTAWLVAASL